ncbi:FHA domain-containing protein [Breznakiella homolactica]|uniref:FHA domain-containing protein n=1 Tax=Breznakiella homolactica TaxID=2798577 RepID=A0A7T7XMD3_9SPIR|nr:FHA domain-containing protein [Breznakiella homolactica]QQO09014.1 FHA domain-containing protein [Breznakiella homolactica]
MGFKYCKEGHVMDPSWKQCPVCLAPLRGWLVQLKDNLPGTVYTIHEGKSFIGSGADCEIRILDGNLSRQHAYMTIADSICSIVDLGNGALIKVNNCETVKTTLIDGDVIQLGDLSFKIKLL